MSYVTWDEQSIDHHDDATITNMYSRGYVFGRPAPGNMYQTRSMRINLSAFEPSSENRRILRKTDALSMQVTPLPLAEYHWSLGKLAKDFYDTKFGDGTFSANKVKELLTTDHNFNTLLQYSLDGEILGYAICYENDDIMHYSYPFYNLETSLKNMGMGMMLRAIQYAKESGKQYIYLGSAQRPTDTYKLQFKGLEWFNKENWQTDQDGLKVILAAI